MDAFRSVVGWPPSGVSAAEIAGGGSFSSASTSPFSLSALSVTTPGCCARLGAASICGGCGAALLTGGALSCDTAGLAAEGAGCGAVASACITKHSWMTEYNYLGTFSLWQHTQRLHAHVAPLPAGACGSANAAPGAIAGPLSRLTPVIRTQPY